MYVLLTQLTVHMINDFRNEKLFPELLCFAFKCTIKEGQPALNPSQPELAAKPKRTQRIIISHWRRSHYVTHLRACVIKKATFKGGHPIW